jgi:hypothetical protein
MQNGSSTDRLAANLLMICRKDDFEAHLPIAWFELHRAGLTREWLKTASDHPDWNGPKPRFETAPAYDSPIWKLMEKEGLEAKLP